MYIADIFIINKCDLEGAEKLKQNIKGKLGLSSSDCDWRYFIS